MILKILYTLNNDSKNLYLCKSSTTKLDNFNFKVVKLIRPNNTPQLIGLVNLRDCISLVLRSSPELFQINGIYADNDGQRRIKVADYSVYNKDILEEDSPLVGHGSARSMIEEKGKPGEQEQSVIAGFMLKNLNFLLHNTTETKEDEEHNEMPASNDSRVVVEQLPSKYMNSNLYSLEIKLEFIKYYKEYETREHHNESSEYQSKAIKKPVFATKRKTNSIKAPKASRTLSLPVFIPEGFSIDNQPNSNGKKKLQKKPNATQSKYLKEKLFEADSYNDQPESPSCINCEAQKSSRWSWFKGASSEKGHAIEGLICKECDEYYKEHDKMKPIKQQPKGKKPSKTKKRKSSNGSDSDPENQAKGNVSKKAKSSSIANIAETLAKNRSVLNKEKNSSRESYRRMTASSPIYDKYQLLETNDIEEKLEKLQNNNQEMSRDYSTHNITSSPKINDTHWDIDQITDILKTPCKNIQQATLQNDIKLGASPGFQSPNSKWLSHMLKTIGTHPDSPTLGSGQIQDFGFSSVGLPVEPLLAADTPRKKVSRLTETLKQIEQQELAKSTPTHDGIYNFDFEGLSHETGKKLDSDDSSHSGLNGHKESSSLPSSPLDPAGLEKSMAQEQTDAIRANVVL